MQCGRKVCWMVLDRKTSRRQRKRARCGGTLALRLAGGVDCSYMLVAGEDRHTSSTYLTRKEWGNNASLPLRRQVDGGRNTVNERAFIR
jgi:hypothetical protein